METQNMYKTLQLNHYNQLKQISTSSDDRVFNVPTQVLDFKIDAKVLKESTVIKPQDLKADQPYLEFLNQGYMYGPVTKFLAIDCEMDGGPRYYPHQIIRFSLINEEGNIVFESLVKPMTHVTQSRTFIHGIYQEEYVEAPEFKVVQEMIKELAAKEFIFVGHSTRADLKPFDIPEMNFVDIAQYETKVISLKNLASKYLNASIQEEAHSSLIDARVTMALFLTNREVFSQKIQPLTPAKVEKDPSEMTEKEKKKQYYRNLHKQQVQAENCCLDNIEL